MKIHWHSMVDSVANHNTELQQTVMAKFTAETKGGSALGYLCRLVYKMFVD